MLFTLASRLISTLKSNLLFKSVYNFALRAKLHKTKQVPFKNWQITKGDIVKVRTGSDKGKVGKVSSIDRKNNRVRVLGVNKRIKIVSNFKNLFRG